MNLNCWNRQGVKRAEEDNKKPYRFPLRFFRVFAPLRLKILVVSLGALGVSAVDRSNG
jgi:hypothetical protein